MSTSSPTALTPDGTLTLNYPGLIAPIVKAIQALHAKIAELASTVASFAEHFTTRYLTFTSATGDEMDVRQLKASETICLGAMCVTESQIITIAGNNPAHIKLGDTYQDLGATAKDSEGHDLGVKTFLNGALVSDIVLDTSATSTDTIDYVATDTNGLTSTSTRTVYIEPASPPASTADAATSTSQ